MKEVPVLMKTAPITEKTIIFDYDAPFDPNGIKKRLFQQKETFILLLKTGWPEESTPERVMRSGISASWFIALDCFAVQQYPAAILFAIISVEALLNRDSRMYALKGKEKQWFTLSECLRNAQKVGINISDLKDENGTLDTILMRRNKIAHGDVLGYIDFLNKDESASDLAKKNIPEDEFTKRVTEKVSITETQALDQIQKTFNFIKNWAESKPKFVIEDND